MRAYSLALLLLGPGAAPAALSAPPPTIRNASIEPRAGGGLERVVRELQGRTQVTWVAYAVPSDGREVSCCGHWQGNGCCGACRLEHEKGTFTTIESDAAPRKPVRLEGPATSHVLVRVAQRRIDEVRMYSDGCVLDLGGRPLVWLDGVGAAESIDFLASLAESHDDEVLSAITRHGSPGDATEQRAVETLIRLARGQRRGELRGQALFWLAQKAGRRSAEAITDAIEKDPETEVKEAAVFALSQLPADEGVPLLIRTARSNRNPAVRERAMFWLGQSEDDRALAFFEEILKR
jgi:hypothetical protein